MDRRKLTRGYGTVAIAALLSATALGGCGGSSHKTATVQPSNPSATTLTGLLLRYEQVNHAGKEIYTLASAGGRISIHRPGRVQLYDGSRVFVCKTGKECELRATGRIAEEYKHLIFGTYLEPYKESLINRLPTTPSPPPSIVVVPSKCRTAKVSGTSWIQCVATNGGFVSFSHVGKTKAVGEVRLQLLSAQTQVPRSALQLPQGK
jgi:hypothetical protein